jgi:hypothetical protein
VFLGDLSFVRFKIIGRPPHPSAISFRWTHMANPRWKESTHSVDGLLRCDRTNIMADLVRVKTISESYCVKYNQNIPPTYESGLARKIHLPIDNVRIGVLEVAMTCYEGISRL